MQRALLQLPGAQSQDYGEQVSDVLALLRGTYRSADGVPGRAVPGEGAQVQVWILGSSGGQSAEVGGSNGLRFAANYHVSPATVLEAVDGYRAAFRPSADLDRPYVSVSADVVVAEDEATARELAAGYGLWVRSIRSGEGAIEFPTPQEARAHTGPTPTASWSPTGSTPSSSAPRARSPTSSSNCGTPPRPTSCWSPPSPTTTPTESARTSSWPRNGSAGKRPNDPRSGVDDAPSFRRPASTHIRRPASHTHPAARHRRALIPAARHRHTVPIVTTRTKLDG